MEKHSTIYKLVLTKKKKKKESKSNQASKSHYQFLRNSGNQGQYLMNHSDYS